MKEKQRMRRQRSKSPAEDMYCDGTAAMTTSRRQLLICCAK